MARGTWVTGVVLLATAVLIPTVFFLAAGVQSESGGDWEGAFGSFILGMVFLFVVSPVLGLVGLILLIVGLASGGQQQQQQVVVYTQGGNCPRCGMNLDGSQRFCSGCGTVVHG